MEAEQCHLSALKFCSDLNDAFQFHLQPHDPNLLPVN